MLLPQENGYLIGKTNRKVRKKKTACKKTETGPQRKKSNVCKKEAQRKESY